MNFRLFDGTVRCMDHMDASSYSHETEEPCLYCSDTHSEACIDWMCEGCSEEPAQAAVEAFTVCDECDEVLTSEEAVTHDHSVFTVRPNIEWGGYEVRDFRGKRVGYTQTEFGAHMIKRRLRKQGERLKASAKGMNL